MSKYHTTIGLEIHAELKTRTKMFCNSKNDPDETRPNVNICPVCMAHPGTLPVINKQAVEHVVRVGLALNGTIADFTEFDRKNYFYPDIPKGYQISQYKYPIVSGGELSGVKITRVHLEEDTANSKHMGPESNRGQGASLLDFNRAGVPLMELVTEPVIHSAKEAGDFGRELQLLLRYLGVSDANMEKGEMRIELNISVAPAESNEILRNSASSLRPSATLGTKVEVKNINSFRAVERAAEYEIKRMTEILEREGKPARPDDAGHSGGGSEIVQETRGWDEGKQKTFSQRKKEDSHDYRYFPDPDLPKLKLFEAFDIERLRASLPELPSQKRARYKKDFGIKDEDIESYMTDMELGIWFEEVTKELSFVTPNLIRGPESGSRVEPGKTTSELIKIASNYITSDYLGLKKTNNEIKLPNAKNFAELIALVALGKISSRAAKDILAMIVVYDESPLKIATEKDLLQKNDEGALKEIAQKIIDANPEPVKSYKSGKENAIMSLVGQVMKETKGSANPEIALKILKKLLLGK